MLVLHSWFIRMRYVHVHKVLEQGHIWHMRGRRDGETPAEMAPSLSMKLLLGKHRYLLLKVHYYTLSREPFFKILRVREGPVSCWGFRKSSVIVCVLLRSNNYIFHWRQVTKMFLNAVNYKFNKTWGSTKIRHSKNRKLLSAKKKARKCHL